MDWLHLCCPHAPAAVPRGLRLPQRLSIVVEPGADVERSYVVRGVVFGAVLAHAKMPARLVNVNFIVLRWALQSGGGLPSREHEQVLVATSSDDARRLGQASIDNLDSFLGSLRHAQVAAVVSTAHVRQLPHRYRSIHRPSLRVLRPGSSQSSCPSVHLLLLAFKASPQSPRC